MLHETDNSYERFLRAVHKVVYVVDRGADRLLAESMGGTFSQFLALTVIAQCPGLSQQKIAESLRLSPGAVSRQLDSLVAAKLIVRTQDPHSRRSHVVHLTEAGEKHFTAMKSLLLNSFKSHSPVSLDELDAVSEIMEKVLGAFTPKE